MRKISLTDYHFPFRPLLTYQQRERNEECRRILSERNKNLEYIRAQRGKRYGPMFGILYIIGANECYPLYYRIIIDKTKFI